MTASELLAALARDPAYVQRRKAQDEAIRRDQLDDRLAEAPLLQRLADEGVIVDSVWDLVNTTREYDRAIPVLLEALDEPFPVSIREGIARALAVPGARVAWQRLATAYRLEKSGRVRQGLAVALAGCADSTVADELVALARDPRNGESRLLLVSGCGRFDQARAHEALEMLSKDPLLAAEALKLRRKRTTGNG